MSKRLSVGSAGVETQTTAAVWDLGKLFPVGWVVYMLECMDGSLYTGISNNLSKRLRLHLSGSGAKYTRSHPPSKLVYVEPCQSQSQALQREMAIKQLSREKKVTLARSFSRLSLI